MKIKTENGNMIFNIADLLDELTGDAHLELIESLSCQEAVIKHVSDQLITGYTENGWSGAKGCSETPHTALDKAIRAIAENSGEIAKREIENLVSLIKSKEKFLSEAWAENKALKDKYIFEREQ